MMVCCCTKYYVQITCQATRTFAEFINGVSEMIAAENRHSGTIQKEIRHVYFYAIGSDSRSHHAMDFARCGRVDVGCDSQQLADVDDLCGLFVRWVDVGS
jgi:hypothetical protein